MIRKGDVVKFSQYVEGGRRDKYRKIYHHDCPETYGVVLGYSFIQEGKMDYSEWYDTGAPPYIPQPTYHKVLVIEPFTHGQRYIEPVRVLEKDVTLIFSNNKF